MQSGTHTIVLIETSWNVKVELQIERFFDSLVLIETSWNVKSDMTLRKAPELQVLIETSWNVKVEYINFLLSHHLRINRNIVECKGVKTGSTFEAAMCINRNIVECKGQKD